MKTTSYRRRRENNLAERLAQRNKLRAELRACAEQANPQEAAAEAKNNKEEAELMEPLLPKAKASFR